MKSDARVRYTKQTLKNALLSLLENKTIKQITVKEVCEIAELNRATFYTHYADCYDLLEQIENELLSDYTESLKYLKTFDATNMIIAIFDMIEKNIELCQTLIFHHTDADIIKKMINLTHDKAIFHWKKQLKKATDTDLEMLFTCLTNGLMHVVIEGYQKYEKEQIIAFVNKIVQSTLAPYL